jgi:hypothetical protein
VATGLFGLGPSLDVIACGFGELAINLGSSL